MIFNHPVVVRVFACFTALPAVPGVYGYFVWMNIQPSGSIDPQASG